MRRVLVVAVYFFARLVKHASPTVICCKMSSKRPHTASSLRPPAIGRTAGSTTTAPSGP